MKINSCRLKDWTPPVGTCLHDKPKPQIIVVVKDKSGDKEWKNFLEEQIGADNQKHLFFIIW